MKTIALRPLPLLCLSLLSASLLFGCSSTPVFPLGQTALATAEGVTVFASTGRERIRLGSVDGGVVRIDLELPRVRLSEVVTDVCAVSAEAAWATVDGSLFHRTAGAWERVPLALPGVRPEALMPTAVACVAAEHVVITSWVDDMGPYRIEIDDGVVVAEPLPVGMDGGFATSPDGALLATGSPLRARRAGAWVDGPTVADSLTQVPRGDRLVAFDASGRVVVWSGGELEETGMDLTMLASPVLGPEELVDVRVIGEDLWAVSAIAERDCFHLFGVTSCDDLPWGSRVLRRLSAGRWENVAVLEGQLDLRLVEIEGEAHYLVGEPDGVIAYRVSP